jgi:hypothetical protein
VPKRGKPRGPQAKIKAQSEDKPYQELGPQGSIPTQVGIKGITEENNKNPEIRVF